MEMRRLGKRLQINTELETDREWQAIKGRDGDDYKALSSEFLLLDILNVILPFPKRHAHGPPPPLCQFDVYIRFFNL